MSSITDSGGGYTVPNQLLNRVIQLVSEFGIARRKSHVFNVNSDVFWAPKGLTNTTAHWHTQNEEKEDSEPTFEQVEVLIKTLAVVTKIPNALIDDSVINVIDYVVQNMAMVLSEKEDDTIFYGDGSESFGGITGLIPAIQGVASNMSIVTPAVATWAGIVLADFNNMMGRLSDPAWKGQNPEWYCSNGFYHSVMNRVKAAGGDFIASIEAGFKKQFMGYNVNTTAIFPATEVPKYNPSDLTEFCMFGRLDLCAAFASSDHKASKLMKNCVR